MRIHLICVGQRMDAWVSEGYQEYAQRLPPECALNLIELPLAQRSKSIDTARVMRKEGEAILAKIPKGSRLIALDVRGAEWTTEQLSAELQNWMQDGRDVTLVVGGPDGLAPEVLAKCEGRWSLSRLTFPHPLVRVVLAEQIYRAWSILRNHPYHRAG